MISTPGIDNQARKVLGSRESQIPEGDLLRRHEIS